MANHWSVHKRWWLLSATSRDSLNAGLHSSLDSSMSDFHFSKRFASEPFDSKFWDSLDCNVCSANSAVPNSAHKMPDFESENLRRRSFTGWATRLRRKTFDQRILFLGPMCQRVQQCCGSMNGIQRPSIDILVYTFAGSSRNFKIRRLF